MSEKLFFTPCGLQINTLPVHCSNVELAQVIYRALIEAIMEGDETDREIFETVVSNEDVIHTAYTCTSDLVAMNGSVFGLISRYAKAIVGSLSTIVHVLPPEDACRTVTTTNFDHQNVNITRQ